MKHLKCSSDIINHVKEFVLEKRKTFQNINLFLDDKPCRVICSHLTAILKYSKKSNLNEITLDDVFNFLNDSSLSKSYLKSVRNTCKIYLNLYSRLPKNKFKKNGQLKIHNSFIRHWLNVSFFLKIISSLLDLKYVSMYSEKTHFDTAYCLLFQFLTGLRMSTVKTLTDEQQNKFLNLENVSVFVKKSNTFSVKFLLKIHYTKTLKNITLLEHLKNLHLKKSVLFPNRNLFRLAVMSNLTDDLTRGQEGGFCNETKTQTYGIGWHEIRRLSISSLYNEQKSHPQILEVARLLADHKSIQTTLRYIKIDIE